MDNKFDAIVVGTGISGGWAAKELTEKLKTNPENNKLAIEIGNLQEKFEQIDGWGIEKRAEIILYFNAHLPAHEYGLLQFCMSENDWLLRCLVS